MPTWPSAARDTTAGLWWYTTISRRAMRCVIAGPPAVKVVRRLSLHAAAASRSSPQLTLPRKPAGNVASMHAVYHASPARPRPPRPRSQSYRRRLGRDRQAISSTAGTLLTTRTAAARARPRPPFARQRPSPNRTTSQVCFRGTTLVTDFAVAIVSRQPLAPRR